MSVWPAWRVREQGGATSWFHVRLAFPDGARVDALAVLSEGSVSVEDVRARPALSLDDLTALADWIEIPLVEACGLAPGPADEEDAANAVDAADAADAEGEESCRARPGWPHGVEGRWLVAREYRAAQEEGADPVLAVMRATGHNRRRSLRLISQARDAGFLTPRHARR